MSTAWESFDAELYAQEMMAVAHLGHRARLVKTDAQLSALRHIPRLHNVHLTGDHHDLSRVTSRAEVEQLFVSGNRRITDVAQLAAMERLRKIGLSNCPQIRSIAPLARPGLEWLSLAELHPSLDPSPLTDMPDLRHLGLGHPFLVENIGALPVCDQVTGLDLMSDPMGVGLPYGAHCASRCRPAGALRSAIPARAAAAPLPHCGNSSCSRATRPPTSPRSPSCRPSKHSPSTAGNPSTSPPSPAART
ncbi:hypothetical protein SMICM17S_03836 [Streptomyces microflavus]